MDLFPFLHSDVKTLPFPVNGSKYRPEVLRIQAYGLILLVMIYAVVLCIILANTFTCVFYITTVFVNQKLLDSNKNVLINALSVDNPRRKSLDRETFCWSQICVYQLLNK